MLSLLLRAQKQNDYWLPKPAIEEVARMLGMPYIRVLEVATFYTMFNLEPVGRYFIQMCGTTPCQLRGSDAIKDVLHKRIGAQRKVTADGMFSWLEVECLGACCNAPMVQINDDYYEDLTPETFEKLLEDLAAGRPVHVGPQNGRMTSEPEGGLTSLTTWYGKDGRSGPGFGEPANDQGPSTPRSGARDERTTKDKPDQPVDDRRTERHENSLGSPATEELTAMRTNPTAGPAGQPEEEQAQSDAKGGAAPDAASDVSSDTPKKD
ncbi:NADH-quinone oxidoreductase subunit E 1 [Beijerinckiaceae bacterium RH AL1]|nr:NADH-quinone oxidoreductase subunit E 1 [Beijerinckiaceae bacterium RH AL1]